MSSIIPNRAEAADAYFGQQQTYVTESTTEGLRPLPNSMVCTRGQALDCVNVLWGDKGYLPARAATPKIIQTSNPNFDVWGYVYTDAEGNKVQHFVAETFWQWQAALALSNKVQFDPTSGQVTVEASVDRTQIEAQITNYENMKKQAQATIVACDKAIADLKAKL